MKGLHITLLLLLFLTGATALAAGSGIATPWLAAACIMGLAFAKFQLVAWQFMDLKGAHPFWKRLLVAIPLLIMLGMAMLAA